LEERLIVIGGGLAGCEAVWQTACRGIPVDLYEMKPSRFTPAHKSENLAELVCSNSLKSVSLTRATGILKQELKLTGSLIMDAALATRVPAGEALAVNRDDFSAFITSRIEALPNLRITRQELTGIPPTGRVIVATGPLTSAALTDSIADLTKTEYLYFYDAIAPIIDADSIDREDVFLASRYDRGEAVYLNCPMNKEEYDLFVKELLSGDCMPFRDFEKPRYFSGCQPVEEIAASGPETLAHGPLKPVGLIDPQTGARPYAVVQLRPEDKEGRMYNMVGFQTKLTYPEQERIFRLIPGLKHARFLRLGSLHRNTFINAPRLLDDGLRLKSDPRIRFAGQLAGVEGYLESTAAGLWAGLVAVADFRGKDVPAPPASSALGSLLRHLREADPKHFQPMPANLGLFPPPPHKMKREAKRRYFADRASKDYKDWVDELNRLLPELDGNSLAGL
jgi:methylenetetrahydrofolate--tRNA-(uracil-5-)-methyltransferase